MPTYEYECQKCGYRFEVFQSIKERPKRKCVRPRCNGRVKRLLGTGAGMIFKGSGFYITDYRKPAYKEAAKKDQPGGNGSSTKSDSTSTSASSSDKKSK
ncbi:MAG: zinc ribbon domain-containing protein [Verrucomicrobiae bacterium]|nr:zinc ribbon domain-containing protein [Verrucomicrobiae bacterium]MDW8344334.1 FmdB family zinc ribbon protein [Verrucomicrobiae bacterium]